MKKNTQNQSGTTLIELVVAVAIFATAMLSATQIFQTAIQGQRRSLAAQNVQESIRYAFEAIDKEMRSAQLDEFGACIGANHIFELGPGNMSISFRNVRGECVNYYLLGNVLVIDRNGRALPITPSDIQISNLQFALMPFDSTNQQGFVTIKMNVENLGMKIDEKTDITVQTTIASRYYEEN